MCVAVLPVCCDLSKCVLHWLIKDEKTDMDHVHQFQAINKGGLRTTRFGKGFQRRNERDISNVTRDCLADIAKETEVCGYCAD
jgi:hypothetical protein